MGARVRYAAQDSADTAPEQSAKIAKVGRRVGPMLFSVAADEATATPKRRQFPGGRLSGQT